MVDASVVMSTAVQSSPDAEIISGRGLFPGVLEAVDVRSDEARVTLEFESGAGPELPLGAPVAVRLPRIDGTMAPPVPGRFHAETRDETHDRIVVRLTGSLPRDIGASYGRQAFRVSPDPARRPAARLTTLDGKVRLEAKLADLSVLGVSVELSEDADRRLCSHRELELELELPAAARALQIVVEVRRRRMRDDGVAYGVRFLPDRTPGFREHEMAVARYVMERQRELLR